MKESTVSRLPMEIATVRVATELNGLRQRLERVEHGLEAVFLDSDKIPSGQTIEMLQELDILQQSVGALADYLDKLSGSVTKDGKVSILDAVEVVPLREMASRLSGLSNTSESSGNLELF